MSASKDFAFYTSSFFDSGLPLRIEPVNSGRNNLGLIVQSEKGSYFIKHITSHENADERYKREKNFLLFCALHRIGSVPHLVQYDDDKRLLLESFLPGHKPKNITSNHIALAISFIKELNSGAQMSHRNPRAIDALVSADSAILRIRERYEQVLQILNSSETGLSLVEHIDSQVQIFFRHESTISTRLANLLVNSNRLSLYRTFLSPSDFGFHNSLEIDNSLSFFDFEYSGTDSSVKLCCDFILQPDYHLSLSHQEMFVNGLEKEFGFSFENISFEIRLYFAIKWLLIMAKRAIADERNSVSIENVIQYSQTRILPLL